MGLVAGYFVVLFSFVKDRLAPLHEVPPAVSRVSTAARWIVIVATLVINGWGASNAEEALRSSAASVAASALNYPGVALFTTLPLVIISVVVASAAMAVSARPGHRWASAKALFRPTRTILLSFGFLVGWVVLSVLVTGAVWRVSQTQAFGPVTAFVAFVLFWPLVIFCLASFLAVLAAVVANAPTLMFAARDAHPALPAVVSLVLVLLSTATQVWVLAQVGWDQDQSAWSQVLVLVVAPVVGVAASVYELRWLSRHGVDARVPVGANAPMAVRTAR